VTRWPTALREATALGEQTGSSLASLGATEEMIRMSDQPAAHAATRTQATVRMLAFLDAARRERGLACTLDVDVPSEGVRADELAESLGLPLDSIEGVFHNYTIAGLDCVVMPGDRVAYVPPGTPASHPSFFGDFTTRPRG
jgi:hypothetical protein